MKKIIIATVALLLFVSLVGCQANENTETLTVLTSSGYEPYEMVDTNGDLTGFDIELMEALALEVGVEIEWLDVDFGGIIASLESGQYEVAIAGISTTLLRAESVDFSDVYYNSEDGVQNYLIFEDGSSYSSLADLDGLVVGAQLGTIQAELLVEYAEQYNYTVELRNTNSVVIEEIKLGTIDAMLVENLVADSILEVNTDFAKEKLTDSLDSLYGNAIAFSMGSEWVDVFNTALATLKENGTLATLIEKWFGE
ncbi:MAG: amino acid ABC transporter substrate-binding protein [Tenericutes bacterium]|nr:amino acid ABC transporter substrate-binding protein [Mycoplasmatota bacterium]